MAGNQDRLQENLSASNGPPWAIAEVEHGTFTGIWFMAAGRMPLKPSGFEERQHNLYNRERSNFVVWCLRANLLGQE